MKQKIRAHEERSECSCTHWHEAYTDTFQTSNPTRPPSQPPTPSPPTSSTVATRRTPKPYPQQSNRNVTRRPLGSPSPYRRLRVSLRKRCSQSSRQERRPRRRAGSEWSVPSVRSACETNADFVPPPLQITKPTFVGPGFTRRPVKYERFIRPMGLRYKKANVTHPELNVTVQLPIISVKKNPQQVSSNCTKCM